jgi:phospholipid transport system substrate-binding protein
MGWVTRTWASWTLLLLLCAPLGAGATDGSATADPASAVQTIERLEGVMLELMKNADTLGYQGRFDRIAPSVRETFDIPFMAQKSIGRYWKGLDESERTRWLKTFEDFTISNFADRFDGYSGQSFEIVGNKPASHETLMVLTRLNRPGSDDVELNYRMRAEDGRWRIIDLYSGGKVSEVALRRSEYGSVLKQGGIEKLIASVAAKTAKRARKAAQ